LNGILLATQIAKDSRKEQKILQQQQNNLQVYIASERSEKEDTQIEQN
jgi:hypothetical protein